MIDGDGRHERARLDRDLEIKALCGFLWAFADASIRVNGDDGLHLVALELAAFAGVEWSPPAS